ncbi:hypothetical protein V1514DRAFT_322933 [Lipomyces japonicus]
MAPNEGRPNGNRSFTRVPVKWDTPTCVVQVLYGRDSGSMEFGPANFQGS